VSTTNVELRRLQEEKLKRLERNKKIFDPLHEQQKNVVRSKKRFIALVCGRRGGKSQLAARLIVLSLLKSKRNEWTVYATKSQKQSKNIIWSALMGVV